MSFNWENESTPKRLRVAFFAHRFPVRSETFIYRKIDYLLSHGHSVTVFCDCFNSSLPEARAYRKNVVVTGLFRYAGLDAVFCTPRKILSLPTLARYRFFKKRWDIAHVHFLTAFKLFPKWFPKDVPVIAGVYGYDISVAPYLSERMNRFLHQSIRRCDGLMYSSEFLRQTLLRLETPDVPELILAPEAPEALFYPAERPGGFRPVRLLSVGRLHWSKGYPFALQTMKILLDRGCDFHYEIIGEGQTREELEYSIRELGLDGRVTLLGGQPPEKVAEAMRRADIFFLPSVKEEFGVVLLEAELSGLPIVASRVGGVPEATKEGETSILVEARDPTAAADALQRLILEPELRRRLGDGGPVCAERFDAESSGAKMVDFYRRCIALRRGAARDD